MTQHGPVLAWVMVAVIAAGFLTSGISIILASPWLFFVGAGVIVVGVASCWVTHIVAASSSAFPSRPVRS